MTIEELKIMSNQLVQAIHNYQQQEDFDAIELEYTVIDPLLCRLPRDMVYVEWFDRSDIKNIADNVFAEPVSEEVVDDCMHNLWNFDNSVMDNEIVEVLVEGTVKQNKGE